MTITVEAVYEQGVLKPKQPLPLEEGTCVEITVTPNGEIHDPVDGVIGIITEGPDISLADRHDELLYGPRRPTAEQPLSLEEGASVQVTLTTTSQAHDPLEGVIGICDGPPDGAENHDRYIYGDCAK